MTTPSTAPDPFEHLDVAYVFGALEPAETARFEAHLVGCDACAERVALARGTSGLLAGITVDEVVAEVPQTLLPGLLRRAAVARRRQRWLVGGLSSVAAACLVVLAVLTWPTASSHGTTYRLAAVQASPVSATVELSQTSSGTSITLHCVYRGATGAGPVQYALVVYDRAGRGYPLSTWTLSPGEDQVFPATTALAENQISHLDVTYQDHAILTVSP